jgi:Fe-S-cluster containining protein
VTYDCTRCGACCFNPPSNREEQFHDWVEIEPHAAILRRADLVRKLVTYDHAAVPHLRVAADGRCLALSGALFERVRCTIYAQRPRPCRRVQPGDADCERARTELRAASMGSHGPRPRS